MVDVKALNRRARWLAPTIAAAAVLGLVTLAFAVFGGRHSPRASELSTGPSARRIAVAIGSPAWRLTRLRDEFGTMTVLPAPNPYDTATLTFKANGVLDGNDGVNGNDARYEITRDGYVVRGPVMGGGVGLAGPADSPTARVRGAIDACSTDLGAHVTMAVHANVMSLRAGSRTLVLVRAYPEPRH